jgi:hypothetical protein
MLLLIAFIAVVTFIRAFDRSDIQNNLSQQASIESRPEAILNNQ